jgi:chorismate synthase
MAGNTFGRGFKVTTFGESHGFALGVVIDGVPPLLKIDQKDIQKELDRRKPGQSVVTTARAEKDRVEILSGIFEGKTTGMPIAMLIRNEDKKSQDYDALKDVFRPGHADFSYFMKYGVRDHRGGGRASGRETVARVAAGAIAKKMIKEAQVEVVGYTLVIGGIKAKKKDLRVIESNSVRCPDKEQAIAMEAAIKEAASKGDSLGGVVEIVIKNCPVGLGDPVFDKLDALLAHALMSVGAVKGVEIGAGFEVANMTGSQCNDSFTTTNDEVHMATNNAGGILGGISTGEDIVIRVAVKPTPSISKKQETVDINGERTTIEIKGRHDPSVCPRIVPVLEAMAAITIADCLLI